MPANHTGLPEMLPQALQTLSTNQTQLQEILGQILQRQYLVHVVWQDTTSEDNEIVHRRTGGMFDPTDKVNVDPSFSSIIADSTRPAIAVAGGNVYVAWSDNITGNYEIYSTKSTDGGATFRSSNIKDVSQNEGLSGMPAIASDGRNVYIVWEDYTSGTAEIFYSVSTDDGLSFKPPINLSNNLGKSWSPDIAISGSDVHVIWSDSSLGNHEILYRKSVDEGNTFGSPINVSNSPEGSFGPDIDVGRQGDPSNQTNVYVVWLDSAVSGEVQGDYNMKFTKSLGGGTTFGAPINLPPGHHFGGAIDPAIAVDRENVYVVFSQKLGGGCCEIRFTKSSDFGDTFIDDTRMGCGIFGGCLGMRPAIDASGDNVYIVWTSTKWFQEIYFKMSTTRGDSFQHFSTNLSYGTSSNSDFPAIAIRAIYSIR